MRRGLCVTSQMRARIQENKPVEKNNSLDALLAAAYADPCIFYHKVGFMPRLSTAIRRLTPALLLSVAALFHAPQGAAMAEGAGRAAQVGDYRWGIRPAHGGALSLRLILAEDVGRLSADLRNWPDLGHRTCDWVFEHDRRSSDPLMLLTDRAGSDACPATLTLGLAAPTPGQVALRVSEQDTSSAIQLPEAMNFVPMVDIGEAPVWPPVWPEIASLANLHPGVTLQQAEETLAAQGFTRLDDQGEQLTFDGWQSQMVVHGRDPDDRGRWNELVSLTGAVVADTADAGSAQVIALSHRRAVADGDAAWAEVAALHGLSPEETEFRHHYDATGQRVASAEACRSPDSPQLQVNLGYFVGTGTLDPGCGAMVSGRRMRALGGGAKVTLSVADPHLVALSAQRQTVLSQAASIRADLDRLSPAN